MTRGTERDYLEGSRAAAWARKAGKALGSLWSGTAQRVLSSRAAKAWGSAWNSAPLRATGIFVVSAVLANGLALWLLRKEIGAGGVALRALILLTGLAAARCGGDWDAVREGSFFLRALFPRRER